MIDILFTIATLFKKRRIKTLFIGFVVLFILQLVIEVIAEIIAEWLVL